MALRRAALAAVLATGLVIAPAAAGAGTTRGGERVVAPGEPIQPLLDALPPGATIRLAQGRHVGPLRIERPLALLGEAGAVLAGPGTGSVVVVSAPDVRIEGLEITGSGLDTPAMDSAILLTQAAVRARVRSNRLVDNLFGVYVHGAAASVIENNLISGRRDLRLPEAGNGVAIWNAPGAQVIGNAIRHGRDGIFVKTSSHNVFANNTFDELRFAIHYMYTNDSRIVGNRSRGNHVGWAIMYSDRLEIRDNVSDGDRDHGLMLNSTNRSQVVGNVVRGGREKCVFVYAANDNLLKDNWFEGCPIGIHFTAGSERNTITGNAFVGNRNQVKYVGTRYLDWVHEGRGNYWSDNPAFDLDGDGIADRPYRPNDVVDAILWTLPAAKVLVNSPAVQMVRWAQARFPALYPGGVVDSAPLMRPVTVPPPVLP
ncbi:MAG: nitrous oxide reductase family maturation protein NosD [Lautropia sp.]|nr:MAG: nitrous oxide reductase family maturation protein NosD [Pseudomonadota bacterium]MBC6960225.1 nitrous oxide reductase family maturation protein NosD [Lautropia sp.]MCL4702644.1 nitrous oxide reductase family maturation protein NosD [Burkholderiaceae bacterium]MDL1908040.1 nitrous oxide reductase family maturation protein NosD [Betaproteobacteria bacterium PRO1]RIK89610.1 MAG: nitrous oxide reductase family maturation protein NosD [Burkholderiales bacterium]